MDNRPNQSDGGAHKALLKIPADQLIQRTPLFHQISQEKLPRYSMSHCYHWIMPFISTSCKG
jgi:hypothetical protein